MVGIDGEAEIGASLRGQGGEEAVGDLDEAPALLTHKVPVDGGRQVIGRRSVSEVRVYDDP